MTTKEIRESLQEIRKSVDIDTSGTDIDSTVELGKKLSSLIGLSAECQSEAQRHLKIANLNALTKVDDSKPSLAVKKMDALCADEIAMYEYACRINAGITHKLDFIRTVISLHKTELENSMKA